MSELMIIGVFATSFVTVLVIIEEINNRLLRHKLEELVAIHLQLSQDRANTVTKVERSG